MGGACEARAEQRWPADSGFCATRNKGGMGGRQSPFTNRYGRLSLWQPGQPCQWLATCHLWSLAQAPFRSTPGITESSQWPWGEHCHRPPLIGNRKGLGGHVTCSSLFYLQMTVRRFNPRPACQLKLGSLLLFFVASQDNTAARQIWPWRGKSR